MVVEGWVGDGPWANPPKTRIRTHFWGLLLGCRCAATAPVMSSEKTQETKQTLSQQNHTVHSITWSQSICANFITLPTCTQNGQWGKRDLQGQFGQTSE